MEAIASKWEGAVQAARSEPAAWLVAAAAGGVGVIILARKLAARREEAQLLPLPPGSTGPAFVPWVGELGKVVSLGMSPFIASKFAEDGVKDVAKTFFAGQNAVILKGAHNVKAMFAFERAGRIDSGTSSSIEACFGEGNNILLADAAVHKRMRAPIVRALSRDAVFGNVPRMVRVFDEAVVELAKKESFSVRHELYGLVCSIMYPVICGDLDQATTTRCVSLTQTWGKGFLAAPIDLPFTDFGRALVARKELQKILEGKVRAAQSGSGRKEERPDMLYRYATDPSNDCSVQELANNLCLSIFGSVDSTVSMLACAFQNLHQYPDAMERVRAELVQLPPADKLTLDHLDNDVPYTSAFLNETLRLHSPFAALFRRAADDIEFDGFRVPKGWLVMTSHTVCGIESGGQDGELFKPERWLDKSTAPDERFGYIPFGGSRHKCPGYLFPFAEAKILLKLIMCEHGSDITLKQEALRWNNDPSWLPVDGDFRLAFEKRNN